MIAKLSLAYFAPCGHSGEGTGQILWRLNDKFAYASRVCARSCNGAWRLGRRRQGGDELFGEGVGRGGMRSRRIFEYPAAFLRAKGVRGGLDGARPMRISVEALPRYKGKKSCVDAGGRRPYNTKRGIFAWRTMAINEDCAWIGEGVSKGCFAL